MTFKKVMQIIWTMLAVVFLALMYFRIQTDNTHMYRDKNTWTKVNKMTGSIKVLRMSQPRSWYVVDEKK